MPRQVKAFLAGVMIIRLAGFLQLFLILFLRHRGFSSRQASVALGVFGAGIVVATFTGGWLSDLLEARAFTRATRPEGGSVIEWPAGPRSSCGSARSGNANACSSSR